MIKYKTKTINKIINKIVNKNNNLILKKFFIKLF